MDIDLLDGARKNTPQLNNAAMEVTDKANILVVDDRPENLYTLELVLKDLGQNILRADSGAQALKHLLHNQVAVILLDVNMPGIDGFELAGLIREREESRRTPIIFITGYHLPDEHVLKGYKLGAVDYIVKPFVPEIVRSKVAIFVDLFKKTEQIKKQAEALQKYNEELSAEIAERRLAQAQLKFQADILTQINDAVIALGPDRNILYWNKGAERLYGIRMNDVIGNKLDQVIGGSWIRSEQVNDAREGIEKVGYWVGETVQKKKTGDDLHVEMLIAPMKSTAGIDVGQLIIARDISERKKLHGMLVHSEKLAAMGQMAAAVAHELKAPLSVIFGFADLASNRKGAPKDGAPEEPNAMETIKRQVIRCSNLVSNLLDFSRKNSPAEKENFNIESPLTSSLALIEPYAQEKSVLVRKELSDTPVWVQGFKDMLQQVVINLSINAIDAMPKGGTLTISSSKIKEGSRLLAKISVSDTGHGISPEHRKKIFEPFFTTKASGKGTGLGLWLVKEIVANMGGRIECSSSEGQGTMFSVILPAETVFARSNSLGRATREAKKVPEVTVD